jgi:hypothetical protein
LHTPDFEQPVHQERGKIEGLPQHLVESKRNISKLKFESIKLASGVEWITLNAPVT